MAKDASAAVAPAKKYTVQVQSARNETGKRQRILLIAPPKHGKTTAAVSTSAFFPEDFPRHKELVKLNDGFLIQFDASGHDSLGSRRLDIDMVDLSQLTDATEIEQCFYETCAILKERIAAGTLAFAVVDSISELCTKLATSVALRGLDGWDLWGEIAAINTRMFQRIQALPIDLVFTAHLKAKMEDDKGTNKGWVANLPGAADLVVDIPGKTAGLYRRNCSWIMPVVCSKTGKNTPAEYALHPNGTYGIEAGTRYPVNDREPANIGKLLAKIRGNNAA